jgi:transcriptional regulator with XRE-family HTH domain
MTGVGEWLRRKRIERGLTQAQLARRLRTESAAVSRWERGQHLPSLDQFRQLCLTLVASADDGLGLPRRRDPDVAAS